MSAVQVGERITDWRTLGALPVGSVVMARHFKHGDLCAWAKTDDTNLIDEFGEHLRHGWASVAYIEDRTSSSLFAESTVVVLVWRGDDTA